MEEKRKNLINTQQKKILDEIVAKLNDVHPSFYYLSTIELSAEIKKYLKEPGSVTQDKYQLMKGLSRQDIQILLSFHDQ